MKKRLLFLILCTLFKISSNGQTTFQKAYGGMDDDESTSLIRTSDGGYIMTGSSKGDMYLVKTDSNGVLQWTKTYGGTGYEVGNCISLTSDGGYIITGYTWSDTSVLEKALLFKITKDGTLQWTKSYGINAETGQYVQQTQDKGYIVTGGTASNSSSNHLYVFKTDSNGILQWTKRINGGGCCAYNDFGNSIQQISDGGYVLLGYTWFSGASANVCYLAKISVADTMEWERHFLYVNGITNEGSNGVSFQQTKDKGFIITGSIANGMYLLKTDSNGNSQWAKSYSWLNSEGMSVKQTTDGGFVFTGNSSKNVFLFKTTSDGSLQWSKTFGDTSNHYSYANTVLQNKDKGYTIGGTTDCFGSGSYDFYLIKTDSMGKSNCNEFNVSPTVTSFNFMWFGQTAIDTLGGFDTLAFSTGSGGVETVLCEATLDVYNRSISKNIITIFPNPFSFQTTVQTYNTLNELTLTVYNELGQQVKKIEHINEQTILLQRDGLPEGIYLICLTQDNALVSTSKLIIANN